MCLGILGWQILIELKRMTCQCTNLQGKEQISSCIAGKIVFEKHRQTSPTQELTEETGFIYKVIPKQMFLCMQTRASFGIMALLQMEYK